MSTNNNNINSNNINKSFYLSNKDKCIDCVNIRTIFRFLLSKMSYYLRLANTEEEIKLINIGIKQVKEHRKKLFAIIDQVKDRPHSKSYGVFGIKNDKYNPPNKVCALSDFPIKYTVYRKYLFNHIGSGITLGGAETYFIFNIIKNVIHAAYVVLNSDQNSSFDFDIVNLLHELESYVLIFSFSICEMIEQRINKNGPSWTTD